MTLTVVLIGLSSAADAIPAGNLLSGPTTADPAAVYWNPAAMTMMDGTHGMLMGSLSPIRITYERDVPSLYDNKPYPAAKTMIPAPDASFFAVTDATLDSFRFGVGVSFPIVDGAVWDQESNGRPSSTRYYAMQGKSVMFLMEVAAAYRINRYISVGVGLDVVGILLSQDVMIDLGARINQMVCAAGDPTNCPLNAPISRENPAFDALTTVDGVGFNVGVTAGVLITPTPWLRLGVAIHSGNPSVKVPVDVTVEIPPGVTDYLKRNLPSVSLPPLNARGEVENTAPIIVTAGVGCTLMDSRLDLALDLHWIDTSSTSVMRAIISKSSSSLIGDQVMMKARLDSYTFGVRGAYKVLPQLLTALRFEYSANSRPDEFVTPTSIDFHKIGAHIGLEWRVRPWLGLVLEYAHFFFWDRNIRVSRFSPNAFPTTPEEAGLDNATPTGRYSIDADRIGVGARVSF